MTPEDINASIVASIWIAAGLRDSSKTDPTLGGYGAAISEAWEQVFIALVESPRPSSEDPGSSADWVHRQPLIQQMADEVNACMVAVRKRKADAVPTMQAKLAELKAQLCAGANAVPPAIQFASHDLLREAMAFGDPKVIGQVGDILERQERAAFSQRARDQVRQQNAAATKAQADFEAGRAAGRAARDNS